MADLRAQLQAGLGGSYTLERELGRGGMATVFLAQDLKHDRPVALKVLHAELAATLGPDRFLREIRLAARLQHPHILTVLDSGDTGGRLWFTMPYVEGETLRARLTREKQLPVGDALRIAREAASGLEYAHRHGVIHRDIKPENLLLTADGQVLVADFGIGRAMEGASGAERLTETGMIVGTPAYMSPEQAAGERDIDARTDIYSLGTVLYEMLAGEPPFTGPNAQSIIAKRITGQVPSLRRARPTVPEDIERATLQALASFPADRYASAADFARALEVTATTEIRQPSATVAHRARPGFSLRRPVTAALLVGFLIGVGVLFAWRRNHAPAAAVAGERRVAVLPFENLGDSADAYFADGITDAVRGKLTGLPGMRVTGSNSSRQYRGTAKSPQEIGRELGVDYILVGNVRWQKSAGASRVQVSPELIEVASAEARWQQPFDAALTDVFQVQADIAGRVAQALDVAIGGSQGEALAVRPTRSLQAYDAYLKAQARVAAGPSPSNLRQAMDLFERAVALDSGFVDAWVGLASSSALLYTNGSPSPPLADRARTAADRALTLDPKDPDAHWALGGYYRLVVRDNAKAVEQYGKGLALVPGHADLLRGLGLAEVGLGRWEDAVATMRKSQQLDPRSATTPTVLSNALLWLRRYDEALEASDQASALTPSALNVLEGKAMIHLARGDLAAARQVLESPPPDVDLPGFVAYMATYWDLYWPLDDEQRALVKRLTPSAFDNDAGTWGLALAGVYEIEGDRRRAAAYGDSARVAFEQQLTAAPEDPQRKVLHGVALAYLGRKDAAIREGEAGVALEPVGRDAAGGTYYQHQLVRIYILVGEHEKALDRLEPLLRQPYYLSPGWLKLDPTFDPLRKNPRFQRLVESAPTT
jgi:TolB-like protein